MLKDIIHMSLLDLSERHRPKDKLLEMYIQDRLNASLKVYYDELTKSLERSLNRDSIKTIKRVLKRL